MLRFLTIRSRLLFLSLLLIASLVVTNLVLVNHALVQTRFIAEQAEGVDAIVRADAAVQTFGNLKYWLTDLAVSQLVLSEQNAISERESLEMQLAALADETPEAVSGVREQVSQLVDDAMAAVAAYRRGDRLVGNAMMARGRAHILAVDSKLSVLVEGLRAEADRVAEEARSLSERGVALALWLVVAVTVGAGVLTFFIVRSVVAPLREMVEVINAMSAGDMEAPIPLASRDEIGRMAQVLNLFRQSVLQRERADALARRQALIIEQLYDAVIVVDLEGRITDWNQAAERLFGYTREEMLGKPTDPLYEDADQARRLKAEMREYLERGERWVGECSNRRKDGSLIRIEAVVFRLHDERGEPVSTIGVSHDISARKRAEEAFRQSEERFTTIIDHMPATVFLRDLEGRFITINRHYEAVYGADKSTIRGKTNADLFHRELAEESDAHDRDAIREQRVIEREVTVPLKDGQHILWSIKFPIRDASGEMVALGGVEIDITERKRTEALLRRATEEAAEAKAWLSDALENMSEAIVVYDADERLVLCNSRFKEIYHYSDEDVAPGVSYYDLGRLDTQRGTVVMNADGNYLRKRTEHRRRLKGTLDVHLRDGRWLQIRERRTASGGIVSIQADITARKQAEMMLLEAKNEAELASQAKSQFLANMSHELRTPLNAIIGITEMLLEDVEESPDPDQQEALSRITRAGRHLLALINEVLDLSKIEAGKMELHPTDVDLRALIEEVVTTSEPLAGKNGNRLSVNYAATLSRLRADETRMRQVILNLLSNACKFTRDGVVKLAVEDADSKGMEGVAITVSDTGIGIKPEQMPALFQPFMQGDQSTSRNYGGTGLGLTISRHFCQMMGGYITVHSATGRGSTFRAWFPASQLSTGLGDTDRHGP